MILFSVHCTVPEELESPASITWLSKNCTAAGTTSAILILIPGQKSTVITLLLLSTTAEALTTQRYLY